jgi:hypothetical protein
MEKRICRVRDCENSRFGASSLCRRHRQEKKQRKISKAWSTRYASGQRKRISSTASVLKLEALTHYGDTCVGCGESEPGQLSLDHLENNGHRHRLLISRGRAGAEFYRALKKLGWPNKEPYKMETVCHDCHTTRTAERAIETAKG